MKSLHVTICLLAFYTLTLAQSGNIGIGTNTPTAKLEVNGSFKALGRSILEDSVDIIGPASLQNGLSVLNGATIQNGITVDGQSQLNGNVTIPGAISVNGTATLGNGLTVTGGPFQAYVPINAPGATITGNISVFGLATLGNVQLLSGLSGTGGSFSGTLSAGLLNAGNIQVTGSLFAASGNLSALQVTGTTTLNSLQVTGTSNFGNLVAGNATISSNLTVGNTTLNSFGLYFTNAQPNRKIYLYGNGSLNQYIGFENTINTLRYQVSTLSDSHIFYAGINNNESRELLQISGSGNVGINVSNPSNRLDVSIGARYGDHPVGLPLYITSDCGASAAGVEFRHLNGTQGIGFGYNTIYAAGSNPDQHLGLEAKGTGDIIFANNSNETMRLYDDGNLALDGNIINEAFTEPFMLSGFFNYGGDFATAAFFKDKVGVVHLRGLIWNNQDPDNLIIFNLPPGYRPSTSGRLIFSALNNDITCRVDVHANGDVVVTFGELGWINLNGISFRAD